MECEQTKRAVAATDSLRDIGEITSKIMHKKEAVREKAHKNKLKIALCEYFVNKIKWFASNWFYFFSSFVQKVTKAKCDDVVLGRN